MVTQKKVKTPKFNKDEKWHWLEDAMVHEHQGFTFPQVRPSLLLLETPSSLDRKVPMVPGPKDVVILSTTKLGTKRYQNPPDAEFDLTDPQRPLCEYNFLHDPHLKEYLNHPLVRKTLTEKGLVTKDGYVKCTIKEFNDYRQWIRKLKLNAIDQDFHRITAEKNKNNKKDYKNNEALLLTKKRQERAKELYEKKMKNKEKDRERYMKYLEEQDERVEKIKRENKRYFSERKRQRQKERDHMRRKYEENEQKGRKIRFKILINSKKNIEHRKDNVLKLQKEKIMEKEKRAEELWKRRQSYCMEKMQDERIKKENSERERKQSILKRENDYQKERRKSDAYMLQYSKENRENALRHMEEATEFLERIEAKKEAEIKKWREKLKCIKERERLLEFYRQKRLHDKQSGKYRRRHSKSRKSVWDVDQVLLDEIMCHMTENERKELEDFHNELSEDIRKEYEKDVIAEEENFEETSEQQPKPVPSEQDVVFIAEENDVKTSANDLTGKHRSFIVFGNIEKDDIEEVYHEDTHDVEVGENHLNIPGLIIEHTKSFHEHLPCVDNMDLHEFDTVGEQVVKTLHDGDNDEKMQITSVSSYSSYEILVIPSTEDNTSSPDRPNSTDATFIHVIDKEPVLVSSGSIMKLSPKSSIIEEDVIDTAKAIVLASLTSAAKNLGYSDEEIERELGNKLEKTESIVEITETPSQELANYAKEITEMSLIGAAVTLGYSPNEIANALGLDSENKAVIDIANSYEISIKSMAQTAIKNAALSLGYTENEADDAIYNLMEEPISPCSQVSIGLESQKSSISLLAVELAKSAITNAARKLRLDLETSETLGEYCTSRNEYNTASCLSLSTANANTIDEPYIVLAHNALRGAALSLGYAKDEVLRVIGEEKFVSEEEKLRKWAYEITHDALRRGKISFIEQELRTVPCESVSAKCENYIKSYIPLTPPNSTNEISSRLSDNYYSKTFEKSSINEQKGEFDSDVEMEAVCSDLAITAIKNAAIHLGYTEEDVNIAIEESAIETKKMENNLKSANEEINETVLKEKARIFVDDILEKAIDVLKQEKQNDDIEEQNAKYKKAALRFTMIVLGSALQSMGYAENQILRAINDDTRRRTGDKFKEVHPNIAVQFNEASIFRARRESLSIPDKGGRRQSIKDRPSTPKPSKEEIEELDQSKSNENVSMLAPQPQKKTRRPTPYIDANFQQQIIKAHEKDKKTENDIIEEDEEEEEEEEESSKRELCPWEKNVSITCSKSSNRMMHRDSLHRDFSNFKESEIFRQINEETQHDASVLDVLSEYPTEGEFLSFAKKQEQLQIDHPVANHEKSLMDLLGHEQLAPGILDLYNAIQTDITRLLTNVNSRLLSFHSNTTPSIYSPDRFNHVTQHTPQQSPNQYYVNQRMNEFNRGASPLVIQAMSPNIPSPCMPSQEKLPAISTNNSPLSKSDIQSTICTPVIKESKADSKIGFENSFPSITDSRRNSPSKLISSSSNNSPIGSLPSINHSTSIILSAEKICDARNTTNEEMEVVLKAPKDFQKDIPLASNYRFKSCDQIEDQSTTGEEPNIENIITRENNKSPKKLSPTPPKTSSTKLIRKSRSNIIDKQSSDGIFQPNDVTKSSNEGIPSYARPLKRVSLKSDAKERPLKSPRKNSISTSSDNSSAVFERLSSMKKTPSKEEENTTRSQNLAGKSSTSHASNSFILQNRQSSSEKHSSSYKALAQKLSKMPLKSSIILSPVPESPLKPPSNISLQKLKNEKSSFKSNHDLSPPLTDTKKSQVSLDSIAEKTSKTNKHASQKSSKIEKNTKNISEYSPSSNTKSINKLAKEKNSKFSTRSNSNSLETKENVSKKVSDISKKSDSSKNTALSFTKQTRPKSSISTKPVKTETRDKSFKELQSQQSVTLKKKVSVKPKRKSKKSIGNIDDSQKEVENNGSISHNQEMSPSKHETSTSKHQTSDKAEASKTISPTLIERNVSVASNSQLKSEPKDVISNSREVVHIKDKETKSVPQIDKSPSTNQQAAPLLSNKPSTRKSMNRPSVSRNLEKSPSKFSNIASVTTLSLDYDDKLKTSTKSYSQRLLNSEVADDEELSNKIDTIANIRSSATFEPNPQKPNSTFILSTYSLKSLSAGQTSKKSIFKSRSLGSAGKIMATDSRQRHPSSSFRESLPMMPLNEQGDCTDFSNINSFIDTQKQMRQASKINSSSMMWVPSQSLAKDCDVMVEPSPSALLVKSASVSRQLSASSFKSGHIFVTPAASINFAAPHSDKNIRDPSATSRTSHTEIVEKQISGAVLSAKNSILNPQVDKEN